VEVVVSMAEWVASAAAWEGSEVAVLSAQDFAVDSLTVDLGASMAATFEGTVLSAAISPIGPIITALILTTGILTTATPTIHTQRIRTHILIRMLIRTHTKAMSMRTAKRARPPARKQMEGHSI
jgi:hypothetical protein